MDRLSYPGGEYVQYEYDQEGRLKEVKPSWGDTIYYTPQINDTGETLELKYPNERNQFRQFTGFGQIKQVQHPEWSESNTFDGFGNILTQDRGDMLQEFSYDKLDRIKTENKQTESGTEDREYDYDELGNRKIMVSPTPLEIVEEKYDYDALNRLKTYSKAGQQVASYTYYPGGLRATKEVNGKTTQYIYFNGKVIEELDENGPTARNVWGNELLQRRVFDKNNNTETDGYYYYNSHGDVISIRDKEGNELNSYQYDIWGNIESESEQMDNPFKYSGEIYDPETKLYYLRARYYDPSVGRFISEDTYKGQVDNPLSLNRYTYTRNNPINFIDLSGHADWSITANWSIKEAKWQYSLEDDLGAKTYWANKAESIRDDLRAKGVAETDILQSTDPMIPENKVMNIARSENPGLAFVADISKVFWDYPGEAGAVAFIGSVNRIARGGSLFETVTNLAKKYKLSDDRFVNHILHLHGPSSTVPLKSKFNGTFDIKAGIQNALTSSDSLIRPNSIDPLIGLQRPGYIFELKYSSPIDKHSNGVDAYWLKVVIGESGNVITAYPK